MSRSNRADNHLDKFNRTRGGIVFGKKYIINKNIGRSNLTIY